MKNVQLPNGDATSQIGFGCAALAGGAGLRESQRLINAALDAGIRHFDVAPIYGSGLAEDALGACLRHVREPVTITTKVGLARPAAPMAATSFRKLGRALLSATPALRQKIGKKVYDAGKRTAFGVDQVESSFRESLRRLGRERVDILLLHEADPADITEPLLRWLERQKSEGSVGVIGFGVQRPKVAPILRDYPNFEFVQTSWAPGDPAIAIDQRFLSTHGALRALPAVRTKLSADPVLRDSLSAETGLDLIRDTDLARGLLGAALVNNPKGMVLIATSRPERIAELVSDTTQDHPALRL